MSIIIPPAARRFIFWPAIVDADPTGSTVTFEILFNGIPTAGSPYAMTWQGSVVQVGAVWAQTARTNLKFIGSTATAGSDIKLTPGLYACRFLITLPDAQVVPGDQFRLVVQ